MVITFDDLPMATPKISLEHAVEINKKILAQLKRYKVPAIGFVNESKINVTGEVDERIDILRLWVNQGLELGNHTYSHRDYANTPFEVYTEDINKGEVYTKSVLQEKNKEIRYLRPPYLNTGNTESDRNRLELFLKEKGYAIAPATIENSDFIFNLIYLKAKVESDSTLMRSTIADYLDFTAQRLQFYEDVALEVTGTLAVPQIFLCHVNALNADCLSQLLDLFQTRGYTFVSLDEALKDTIYSSANTYAGDRGISWLLRWDDTSRENLLAEEPKVNSATLASYKEVGESQFWIFLKPRILGYNPKILILGGAFIFMAFLFMLWLLSFRSSSRSV
ncbi:hypothetical protein GCM10027443_33840 [Pontibacter brevis]